MARIRTPAIHWSPGSPAGTFREAPPADASRLPEYRPYFLPRSPQPRDRAVKSLVPGGILLTVLGAGGIVLGATTLNDDSQDNAVSASLIVSSALLALIGAGLIIAGASMRRR